MNTPQRILRVVPTRAIRCYSSSSSEYIPGRRGYAPGFAAPANSKSKPKSSKQTPLETTLASHLPGAKATSAKPEAKSKMNEYRDAVRSKRFEYAQELLTAHAQRKQTSQQKQDQNSKDLQSKRDKMLEEKKAAITHEQEVIHELELDSALPTTESENRDQRRAQRLQNYRSQKHAQSDARLNRLLSIYHDSNNFITKDNLESKITDLIEQEYRPPFLQTYEDMRTSVDVGDIQVLQRREAELRDVMEGTVSGQHVGVRAIREWVDKQ
ncbi:hypothetical protein NQZ79_g1582 [Umbelopsis isabellina]|nr:hypothetical protein NQZ79_g1582 [Umbelopsis isabellina]